MNMRTLTNKIILILMLFSFGCGYHFKSNTISFKEVDSFSKVIVKNKTYEPGLKLLLKEKLTSKFSANNWLATNGDQKGAATFLCVITRFDSKAVSHRTDDAISQYEAVISFDVTIYDEGAKDNAIYSLKDRRYTEQYIVDNDIAMTERNKSKAIANIFNRFASDIEDLISQGF